MPLSRLLLSLTAFLFPFALFATTWLYTYPVWQGCGFPRPEFEKESTIGDLERVGNAAPFRLLALGDPQLEGSSSLPGGGEVDVWARITERFTGVWPKIRKEEERESNRHPTKLLDQLRRAQLRRIRPALHDILTLDIPLLLETYRKKIDLWGNDYYLAHIVRTMRWYAKPTHVAVLGDLLGSQWIDDDEFERRTERYWGTVFRGMETVPHEVMEVYSQKQGGEDSQSQGDKNRKEFDGPWTGVLDDNSWQNRVINVVGNHDIGYAGDLNKHRVERFEKAYGKVNWEIIFELPKTNDSTTAIKNSNPEDEIPSLHLVILNSMNLDAPAYSKSLQAETYDFLNHIISTPPHSSKQSTILLTHIPLYKPAGFCVDEPFFDFWNSNVGVREQNMLSDYVSKALLEGIFGLNKEGRRAGIVVNGHDHEGCDVVHYVQETEEKGEESAAGIAENGVDEEPQRKEPTYPFQTHRLPTSPSTPKSPTPLSTFNTSNPQPHLREITLRAIMGQYDGAAGLISAWWDPSAASGAGEWKFELDVCTLGVQHWWWGVHVLDLVVLGGSVLGTGCAIYERCLGGRKESRKAVNNKKQ
jgi:hypothetical protein